MNALRHIGKSKQIGIYSKSVKQGQDKQARRYRKKSNQVKFYSNQGLDKQVRTRFLNGSHDPLGQEVSLLYSVGSATKF